MIIIAHCCDKCGIVATEKIKLIQENSQELCERCIEVQKALKQRDIREANKNIAPKLKACDKCKHTGILHKSIYTVGPGYYDEPDPTIYCTCLRGHALNPDTNFLVTKIL